MKKVVLTAVAVTGFSLGAMAQGSLNMGSLASNLGVTTEGTSAQSGSLDPNSALWFTGQISLQVYYLAGTTVPGNINSFLNTTGGGANALAAITTDGFTLVGSTAGTPGNIQDGSLAFNPTGLQLPNAPTSTTGVLALFATAVGGANAGWSGALAFVNGTGGNLTAVPAGTAANLTGWTGLNENMVLSTPAPEPATIAFAALGLGSFLVARRKK